MSADDGASSDGSVRDVDAAEPVDAAAISKYAPRLAAAAKRPEGLYDAYFKTHDEDLVRKWSLHQLERARLLAAARAGVTAPPPVPGSDGAAGAGGAGAGAGAGGAPDDAESEVGDAPWLPGAIDLVIKELHHLRTQNAALAANMQLLLVAKAAGVASAASSGAGGGAGSGAASAASAAEVAAGAKRLRSLSTATAFVRPFSVHRVVGDPLRKDVAARTVFDLLALSMVGAKLECADDGSLVVPADIRESLLASSNGASMEELAPQLKSFVALHRLYHIDVDGGDIIFPKPMNDRMTAAGKSVADFTSQTVVTVRNKVTDMQMLFNKIRAKRPGARVAIDEEALQNFIEGMKGSGCDFCSPLKYTAHESWGRIESVHCVTTANMAKISGAHGLVLAREHNPHKFTEPMLRDMLRVSEEWFRRCEAAAMDGDAAPSVKAWCPNIAWDILPRGGASQVHSHFQITLRRNRYFAGPERLRSAARRYAAAYRGKNYWGDLARAHDALGLAIKHGDAVALVGAEVIVMASTMSDAFVTMLHATFRALFDATGMRAFSCGIAVPQLKSTPDELNMPVVACICDRMNPDDVRSDVSANELYCSPVVSRDPFETARALGKAMQAAGIACGRTE